MAWGKVRNALTQDLVSGASVGDDNKINHFHVHPLSVRQFFVVWKISKGEDEMLQQRGKGEGGKGARGQRWWRAEAQCAMLMLRLLASDTQVLLRLNPEAPLPAAFAPILQWLATHLFPFLGPRMHNNAHQKPLCEIYSSWLRQRVYLQLASLVFVRACCFSYRRP